MDQKKEKWMDDVFTSMQGSKRATPKPELFTEISNQFTDWKAANSWIQWKYAAVAAVFVLLMNSTALMYYIRQQQANHKSVQTLHPYHTSVTSSYQIY